MLSYFFFFFHDTATTEIYTLSLHDALPISGGIHGVTQDVAQRIGEADRDGFDVLTDAPVPARRRSEEHTSELQSLTNLVCRLLLEKKKINPDTNILLLIISDKMFADTSSPS